MAIIPKHTSTVSINSTHVHYPLPADDQFSLALIDEINEIQSYFPNFTKAEPDAIVIHLWLGDIIEMSTASVEQMLITGANPGHRPKKFHMGIKSIHELSKY